MACLLCGDTGTVKRSDKVTLAIGFGAVEDLMDCPLCPEGIRARHYCKWATAPYWCPPRRPSGYGALRGWQRNFVSMVRKYKPKFEYVPSIGVED